MLDSNDIILNKSQVNLSFQMNFSGNLLDFFAIKYRLLLLVFTCIPLRLVNINFFTIVVTTIYWEQHI